MKKKLFKKLSLQYKLTDDSQKELRVFNQRQDNIVFNALQFIGNAVQKPDEKYEMSHDDGFECRLSKEDRYKPEYQSLLQVEHDGALGYLQLKTRHSVFELERYKRRLGKQNQSQFDWYYDY